MEQLKPWLKQTGLWALAGFMCGVVIGALAFRPANSPVDEKSVTQSEPVSVAPISDPALPEPAASDPEASAEVEPDLSADTDPIEPIAEIEAVDLSPEVEKGLTPALEAAIRVDGWFRKTRLRLHKVLGTGALVGEKGLTLAGKAVIDRVRVLEDHAIAVHPYELEGLVASTDADLSDETNRAKAEARVGAALLRLVMDSRFIRKAGPFKVVSEKKLAEDVAAKRRMTKLAVAFVRTAAAGDGAAALLEPKHPLYAPLVRAHGRYRKYAASGGCKQLPDRRVRLGQKGAAVKAVQERLACEGYYTGPIDGDFGDTLLEAVKTYQRHHELPDEGLVLGQTIRSMNVSMKRRAAQVALALQRLRESLVPELGNYFLYVNLPSFTLRAFEDGKLIRTHKVIVGTNRLDDNKLTLVQGHINRTRLFKTALYQVTINPAWILPERVAKGEVKGKMAEDGEYLEKMNIKKKVLDNGREVLIQGVGKGNVLGKVKFLIEKSNAIYLHDTDKPWLFSKPRRDFSHGCIRVHKAVDFARWLLKKDGFDEDDIERGLRLTSTQRAMQLHKKVPLVTEYVTVDVSDEGLPVFLTDIYGYDTAYAKGELPPLTQIRWGHVRLRPHWVPRVPKAIVDGWRAAGKPAPRDYDPKADGGG